VNSDDMYLGEAVKLITRALDVHAIILFGSRARGKHLPWSDYDLLIIGDFDEPYLDRIGILLELLKDLPIPIEPHPYTLEEALNMLRRGNLIIIDALEWGKILYGDDVLKELRKAYEELKRRGLRRTETTIILPP